MSETPQRTVTLAEWHKEGEERFGKDPSKWRFLCPSCGMKQSFEDWKSYGTPGRDIDRQVGFDCIGNRVKRVCPTADVAEYGSDNRGFGCVYVGGGLFRLNPVRVIYGGQEVREMFEWAS